MEGQRMSDEISEYQKSAAIMALDIKIFYEAAKRKPEMALELFEELNRRKERITTDKEYRDSRFSACCLLFSIKNIRDNES